MSRGRYHRPVEHPGTPDHPSDPQPEPLSTPDALWTRTREQAARALATGALAPIETRSTVLRQAGIPFSVRIVTNLRAKDAAGAKPRRPTESAGTDPFAPPDPALLVGAVSTRYLAMLNRFPVLRHHLLLVTRTAEEQARPLGPVDFDAIARCLDGIDGLAFYNSGPVAGASQRHRHLQLVPFPLAGPPAPTPIEPALAEVLQDPARSALPAYDFIHAVAPLPATAWQVADQADRLTRVTEAMALAYRALAARTGLRLHSESADRPYNLLVTRRWMLLVPRTRDRFDGVSVNALGFAGSLLVRDRQGFETVRSHGPLAILREVALLY